MTAPGDGTEGEREHGFVPAVLAADGVARAAARLPDATAMLGRFDARRFEVDVHDLLATLADREAKIARLDDELEGARRELTGYYGLDDVLRTVMAARERIRGG